MNKRNLDFNLMGYKFDRYFKTSDALDKWLDKIKKISSSNNKESKLISFEKIALDALSELACEEQVYLIDDEKKAFINLMNQLPYKKESMIAA